MTSRTHRADATVARLAPDGLPGLRTAVRRTLAGLFGPPRFDPAGEPGDPGLTGPDSASWQVIGEPAAIAGGLRALLLQIAHPAAMAGVHDHSAFREDPLGRLQRTSAYVTTTTFGSTREALHISGIVRAVHPRVRGTTPDGVPYRAEDPHLLAWVSVALTSSFLVADRAWSPHPVRGERADAFVEEQSRLGALLDPRVDLATFERDPVARAELRAGRIRLPMIEDGTLPTSVAELEEILTGFGPELGINAQGREACSFLRRPPIPRVARSGYQALLGGAIASLRPQEEQALGVDLSRPARAALTARASIVLSAMRVATGVSPSRRIAQERANRSTTSRAAPAAHAVGTEPHGGDARRLTDPDPA